MAAYDDDLLSAATLLLTRSAGQSGRLPAARIRRGVSTIYYALFHFLADQSALSAVGAAGELRARRRPLARSLSHAGMRTAMDKVKGRFVNASVEDLLRPVGAAGRVAVPAFAAELASIFVDTQAKRHAADYDLNASVTESQ